MFHVDQPRGCPRLEGRIMMLPKKAEVEERIPAAPAIESGIFNHPVVVLSREIYLGKVAVFVVTSFDNTPIENRHRDPTRRQSYLPIRPASHPDTSCVLIAAHGKAMKKQSYVNTKTIHEIPFAILRSCWRDDDLHLEEESYWILASGLWKQNVTELAIRLRGHGIFERVHQSAHVEIPVPIFNRGADGRLHKLGYGARYIGASSSPSLPASYGTFIRSSTAATHPPVLKTATTSNARAYDYPRRMYHGYQPVSSRFDTVTLRQDRYPTEQWTNNTGDNDLDRPNWLPSFVIIAFFLVAARYWLFKD